MVVFHVGGAANDPFFAKAERLADLLCAKFPDVTVVKHVQQPDDWKAWAAERAKSLGFDHKVGEGRREIAAARRAALVLRCCLPHCVSRTASGARRCRGCENPLC